MYRLLFQILIQGQNSKLSPQGTYTQRKLSNMDFCGWTANAVHFQTSVVQTLTTPAEHLTDATKFLIPLRAQEWPVCCFYVLEFSRCALKPLNKGNTAVKSGFVLLHLPQTLILVNIMQVQTSLSDTGIHKIYKANALDLLCSPLIIWIISHFKYIPHILQNIVLFFFHSVMSHLVCLMFLETAVLLAQSSGRPQ